MGRAKIWTPKTGAWWWFLHCFSLNGAQTPHCTVASASSLQVRTWNLFGDKHRILFSIFVLHTKQSYNHFKFKQNSSPSHKPTRILTGLGFILGWGMAGATKILVKWKKVWYIAEMRWAARRSEDGKMWHLNWNSCRRGIYFVLFTYVSLRYRAKCLNSPFGIWKWVFHSFRILHWLEPALVQKGHLEGHGPLCTRDCIKLWQRKTR